MARRSAASRARTTQDGVVVPGCYRVLLEAEMARHRRIGGKYGPPAMAADGIGVYRRPQRLLDALEAGQTVVVNRARVERRWPDPPRQLPWPRDQVRSVSVSPDDVVRPTDEEHHWYGRAADGVRARTPAE